LRAVKKLRLFYCSVFLFDRFEKMCYKLLNKLFDNQRRQKMENIEDMIKEIVATYELSPRLEEKIIGIARQGIKERNIEGFDRVYEYIADLIEKFQGDFYVYEKRCVWLDSPINSDSKATFHELLGTEDPAFEMVRLNGEPLQDEYNIELSAEEALSILEGRMDESGLELLGQLIKQTDEKEFFLSGISQEELRDEIPQIRKKLAELIEKYGRDGKFVLPRGMIKNIRFHPLRIKFKKRRFDDGGALAFFRENSDVYGEMSRGQLSKFDIGLYCTLRKDGQLDEAIPETYKNRREYRGHESPLAYFQAHKDKYGGMSRNELNHFDPGLYDSLRRYGQLDEAIPETYKNRREYRGHESPLAYFQAHKEKYRGMSRTELHRADGGLHGSLINYNQLDDAIPQKHKKRRADSK